MQFDPTAWTPVDARTVSATLPAMQAADKGLAATARAYEATFLAEMLKQAGVGRTPAGLGGGAGEDAFSTFLVREYADRLAESGGIGLAEAIVRSLAARGEP